MWHTSNCHVINSTNKNLTWRHEASLKFSINYGKSHVRTKNALCIILTGNFKHFKQNLINNSPVRRESCDLVTPQWDNTREEGSRWCFLSRRARRCTVGRACFQGHSHSRASASLSTCDRYLHCTHAHALTTKRSRVRIPDGMVTDGQFLFKKNCASCPSCRK